MDLAKAKELFKTRGLSCGAISRTAESLGTKISKSTVSRILNKGSNPSHKNAEAIIRAIRELTGYPNDLLPGSPHNGTG